MATVTLTTSSSRVAYAPGSHVFVQNTGGRTARLTCRGVTYDVEPTDRDGGVSIPANGAEVTGVTLAGTTTLDVRVVELNEAVDGGPL